MHTGSVESRTAFHGSRDSEAPGLHMAAASAGLAHAGLQAVLGGVWMAVTQGGALSWAPRKAGLRAGRQALLVPSVWKPHSRFFFTMSFSLKDSQLFQTKM